MMLFSVVAAASWAFAVLGLRNPLLYWLFVLPGTAIHELSHWLVAALLGARPGFPSLLPEKADSGDWTLGSVAYTPNWLTGGLVALAPLYLMPSAAYGIATVSLDTDSLSIRAIGGYVFAVSLISVLPSRADWWLALRFPVGSILALGLASLSFLSITQKVLPS